MTRPSLLRSYGAAGSRLFAGRSLISAAGAAFIVALGVVLTG